MMRFNPEQKGVGGARRRRLTMQITRDSLFHQNIANSPSTTCGAKLILGAKIGNNKLLHMYGFNHVILNGKFIHDDL